MKPALVDRSSIAELRIGDRLARAEQLFGPAEPFAAGQGATGFRWATRDEVPWAPALYSASLMHRLGFEACVLRECEG